MNVLLPVETLEYDMSEEEEDEDPGVSNSRIKAREHKEQLQRLAEKVLDMNSSTHVSYCRFGFFSAGSE